MWDLSSPMAHIKAGHCSSCSAPIWRTATAQRKDEGQEPGDIVLLWPLPSSLYAQTWTPTGYTVGIGYCEECAPDLGAPGPPEVGSGAIIGYERARGRYQDWRSEQYGEFLRCWLVDALGYDEAGRDAVMTTWEQDWKPER